MTIIFQRYCYSKSSLICFLLKMELKEQKLYLAFNQQSPLTFSFCIRSLNKNNDESSIHQQILLQSLLVKGKQFKKGMQNDGSFIHFTFQTQQMEKSPFDFLVFVKKDSIKTRISTSSLLETIVLIDYFIYNTIILTDFVYVCFFISEAEFRGRIVQLQLLNIKLSNSYIKISLEAFKLRKNIVKRRKWIKKIIMFPGGNCQKQYQRYCLICQKIPLQEYS